MQSIGRAVAALLLAGPAVAREAGAQSCADGSAWRYHVIIVDVVPQRAGPLEAFGDVTVEARRRALVLAEARQEGERWRWTPDHGLAPEP